MRFRYRVYPKTSFFPVECLDVRMESPNFPMLPSLNSDIRGDGQMMEERLLKLIVEIREVIHE